MGGGPTAVFPELHALTVKAGFCSTVQRKKDRSEKKDADNGALFQFP